MTSTTVLFLDFDGVLHPTFSPPEQMFSRVDDLAACLLTARTQCDIVISSSWRLERSLTDLRAPFPKALQSRVTGTTGRQIIGTYSRLCEIQEFLAATGKYVDWRALDDFAGGFPPHCKNLLLCDPSSGASQNELDALQAWLSRDRQNS